MGHINNPSSIIEYVENLLHQAVEEGASDIHCEPRAHDLRIRFRIDGMLYDRHPIEEALMHNFIARVKILAHLNIAEKRVPQDGRFSFITNLHTIDVRVSTFPSAFGEKIVLRLLQRSDQLLDLAHLGLEKAMLENFKKLLRRSSGFFL